MTRGPAPISTQPGGLNCAGKQACESILAASLEVRGEASLPHCRALGEEGRVRERCCARSVTRRSHDMMFLSVMQQTIQRRRRAPSSNPLICYHVSENGMVFCLFRAGAFADIKVGGLGWEQTPHDDDCRRAENEAKGPVCAVYLRLESGCIPHKNKKRTVGPSRGAGAGDEDDERSTDTLRPPCFLHCGI